MNWFIVLLVLAVSMQVGIELGVVPADPVARELDAFWNLIVDLGQPYVTGNDDRDCHCAQSPHGQPHHLAEHGDGSHLDPSGSFLKCEITMYRCSRYTGSCTAAVTNIIVVPSGS